jgi:hypothetical protein
MYKQLLSGKLPLIDPTIKELVNFGNWKLYEIKKDEKYLLKTDQDEYYILTPNNIEKATEGEWSDVQSFDNAVIFSDVKMPPTLQNFA